MRHCRTSFSIDVPSSIRSATQCQTFSIRKAIQPQWNYVALATLAGSFVTWDLTTQSTLRTAQISYACSSSFSLHYAGMTSSHVLPKNCPNYAHPSLAHPASGSLIPRVHMKTPFLVSPYRSCLGMTSTTLRIAFSKRDMGSGIPDERCIDSAGGPQTDLTMIMRVNGRQNGSLGWNTSRTATKKTRKPCQHFYAQPLVFKTEHCVGEPGFIP
jgi:hypothetical protein